MRFANSLCLIAASFVVGCLVAGCQFETGSADKTTDNTPTIAPTDVEIALTEVSAGNAVLLDVRSKEEWDGGHYELATSMPIDDLKAMLEASDISKDTRIFTHCARGVCATKAADQLNEMGYNAVPLKTTFSKIGEGGFELSK